MTEPSKSILSQKLGDFTVSLPQFPCLKEKLDGLQQEIALFSERKKAEKVHKLLLSLIQESKPPCFLLRAVSEFISAILERKIVEGYSLSSFELWLNLFSGLSEAENYLVRAKIMGKYIPREAYQTLFPVGSGKMHPGSHYVTAHSSPDLDTTVASFWGWVDAFSARVSEGMHLWNVPGGAPEAQVEVPFLFSHFLGQGALRHFAKTRSSLALSAIDLVTRKGVVQKNVKESVFALDYDQKHSAVILVDEEGNYLTDWKHLDVEGVRKVSTLFHACMRWFASYFQRHLTIFFSKSSITRQTFKNWIDQICALRFSEVEIVHGFTKKQKQYLEACLVRVLGVSKGLEATFYEFWQELEKLSHHEFAKFRSLLEELPHSSSLFDPEGYLIEDRSKIFSHLEAIVTSLESSIQALRTHMDQLGVGLAMKKEVFAYPLQVVTPRMEVEEIRSKIGPLSSITVVSSDAEGTLFPIGIIPSTEIFKPILGTVSLRDFCNREETKIPSYFEVISVIDHHKTSLSTIAATTVFIADAQSANALVAEKSFEMNDAYGTSGCRMEDLSKQRRALQEDLVQPSSVRILQRVLQKHLVHQKKQEYFIDPRREYLEYLHYLYAILDDTDLLSKTSYRDILCVASLLNRLKTIQMGKEAEVVSLEDLLVEPCNVSSAAKKLLQNEELYSLYQKIYSLKELAFERNLSLCVQGEPSNVFADTKVQNGCCRVGQTKLFAKNFPFYQSHADKVRSLWYLDAKTFYAERQECDLHLHMISTVPGADDVYQGKDGGHSHQDELWIWIPMQEQAIEHLQTFLNAFSKSPQVLSHSMEVEFLGENRKELQSIFVERFVSIKQTAIKKEEERPSLPIAVLRYKAGLLNSRKAMISPYLPKVVS